MEKPNDTKRMKFQLIRNREEPKRNGKKMVTIIDTTATTTNKLFWWIHENMQSEVGAVKNQSNAIDDSPKFILEILNDHFIVSDFSGIFSWDRLKDRKDVSSPKQIVFAIFSVGFLGSAKKNFRSFCSVSEHEYEFCEYFCRFLKKSKVVFQPFLWSYFTLISSSTQRRRWFD